MALFEYHVGPFTITEKTIFAIFIIALIVVGAAFLWYGHIATGVLCLCVAGVSGSIWGHLAYPQYRNVWWTILGICVVVGLIAALSSPQSEWTTQVKPTIPPPK
jgi:hypothetical protein